jgi:ATP-dependent DNA helicase RecG
MLGELSEAGTLSSGGAGTQVDLLTSSTPSAQRKQILARIASGEAGIVIGTHSLIQESVEFHDLGIVIIDEQHRFGVEQRDSLRAKGKTTPHMLVMTATPIPRTVAMTVFGDLDVSTLRTLPHGRQPIITHVIPVREKPHFVDRAWERIKEEVAKGHQAYVVAPRISENGADALGELTPQERAIAILMGDLVEDVEEEKSQVPMASVEKLAPELALGPLKGLKVALLHGRLPAVEKEATMLAFTRGEIDVLVSTTVIEVGVDVPNATMMVIMDADRFGVSQLHQLRGRVGRGGAQGLCLLISSSPSDSPAMERLTAVASTTDGFALAQIDLEHRSEGDVLGSIQSGRKSHLRLLRVLENENLILDARREAVDLISRDGELNTYPLLAQEIDVVMAREESRFMEKG